MLAPAPNPSPNPDDEGPPTGSGSEPVTAPLSIERIGEIVVLRPAGKLGRNDVEQLRDVIHGIDGPVVVVLDDCVLVAPTAFDRHDRDDGHAVEMCIVCRRLTCRHLLARVGVADRFPVFQHLEDALQARVLARAGYGDGWRTPSSPSTGP